MPPSSSLSAKLPLARRCCARCGGWQLIREGSQRIHAQGKNTNVITMFAQGNAVRIILLVPGRVGGCALPSLFAPLLSSHPYLRPCLQYGKVVRLILFANRGGLCPSTPPAFCKASMLTHKNHVFAMFAAREGKGG